jgi:uncharacterized protein (TIGR00369 family)
MTGLEILRAIISGDLPAPPISKTLSLALVEADEGRVVFKGLPKVNYLNPGGSVHGGWTATIMDSALACVVHSVLKRARRSHDRVQAQSSAPVMPDMGEVTCEANIVSRGRTIGVSEARMTDSRGRFSPSARKPARSSRRAQSPETPRDFSPFIPSRHLAGHEML